MTHVLESLLDRIRKGEITLTTDHVDAFLAAKDVLTMLIDGHRRGSAVENDLVAEVSKRLNQLSAQAPQPVQGTVVVAGATPPPVVHVAPSTSLAAGMHQYTVTLPVTSQPTLRLS